MSFCSRITNKSDYNQIASITSKSMKNLTIILLSVLLHSLLVACHSKPITPTTNPPTAVATPTINPPTATATAVVTTPEPTPTLTSPQKSDSLIRLMVENGGCELPCWWGIVPGETDFAEIYDWLIPQGLVTVTEREQLYVALRQERLVAVEGSKELHARGDGSTINIQFEVQNDIIQSINVRGGGSSEQFADDWGRYSLDQLLSRYGVPSEVFVYYSWQADQSPASYRLFLFYHTLGIEIDYVGLADHATVDGKSQVCPNLKEVNVIHLFLYQPGEIDNVVEQVIPAESVRFVGSEDVVYERMSWEQAVGTSLETFYEMFKEGDSHNCFDFMIYR